MGTPASLGTVSPWLGLPQLEGGSGQLWGWAPDVQGAGGGIRPHKPLVPGMNTSVGLGSP